MILTSSIDTSWYLHNARLIYSWLSLSRTRLSRITAYLELKIWSLPNMKIYEQVKTIVEKRRTSWYLHNARLIYSWLSSSRTRLSRITAYLEVKIWSLPKHENLRTSKKYCGKEESNFSSFPQYFRYISNVKCPITYKFVKCGCSNYFFLNSEIWYVEVRVSRSVSEGPLEFEIKRVDCIPLPHSGWANSAEYRFMFFLVFPENRLWHFMHIVSWEDNLQEMSKPFFREKIRENTFQIFIGWNFYPARKALTQ